MNKPRPNLVSQAFCTPITNPRRKLILVAIASLAGRRTKLLVNPMEIASKVGLDQQEGGETVVDHIKSLSEYVEAHGVLDAAIPMMRLDLTKLLEFDDFGGIA